MNYAEDLIEIKLSKRKLVLMLVGSVAFVAGGIWFQFLAQNPPSNGPALFREPWFLRFISAASITFFGIIGVSILLKLRHNLPGLVISRSGITDNASAINAGEIPWSDIVTIEPIEVVNQKLLMVIVKNPEEYINRQPNILKRKVAEMNYKSYGSPISISANGLQCSFEELVVLLKGKIQENKRYS